MVNPFGYGKIGGFLRRSRVCWFLNVKKALIFLKEFVSGLMQKWISETGIRDGKWTRPRGGPGRPRPNRDESYDR